MRSEKGLRPLRILHLLDSLRVGGKERQAVELIKGLQKREGVSQMVVTMDTDQFYLPDLERAGVKVNYLLRWTRWDPIVFLRLGAMVRKYSPSAIHTNSGMATFYAWPVSRFFGVKLIDGSIRNAFSGSGIRWRFGMFLLGLADARVANSSAGFLSRDLDSTAEMNFIIPNGFDLERFVQATKAQAIDLGAIARGRKIVAMIAEFSPYKDYPTYVRAARIVLQKRRDVVFIAVGGGAQLEQCKQMTADLPDFHFLGPRKDIEAIVKQVDIGVLCTFTEGISNALMECMAAGKPVIVAGSGGNSELISEGVDGFILPTGDAGTVADRVEWLLDNSAQSEALGDSGRAKIATRFSLEKLVDRTSEMYERVVVWDR